MPQACIGVYRERSGLLRPHHPPAMPLPANTTLLIVGAGPAGMSLALSLQHQGVNDFVVVDATDQEEHSSRAMVIHAATLEVHSQRFFLPIIR